MRYVLPLMAFLACPAQADPPVTKAAMAARTGTDWRFDVTLRHPDSGWGHYADGWEVLAPDGQSLALRVLLQPHEAEQPFTRSLGGVFVAAGLDHVIIRARCLVEG